MKGEIIMESVNAPIWESNAVYCGQKNPFEHYILTDYAITVTKGVFSKKTQNVPLHRIVVKEITANFIDRLFGCGRIQLITRGREVPNIELCVKNPENVLTLIEETSRQERVTFRKKMW